MAGLIARPWLGWRLVGMLGCMATGAYTAVAPILERLSEVERTRFFVGLVLFCFGAFLAIHYVISLRRDADDQIRKLEDQVKTLNPDGFQRLQTRLVFAEAAVKRMKGSRKEIQERLWAAEAKLEEKKDDA